MIRFQTEDVKFTLRNRALLKQWIKEVITKKKRKAGEISFVFCSDNYLLDINRHYLKHDTYTDIITFDYSLGDHLQPVSGDVFISIDRVKDNAVKYSNSFESELNRIIIHGVLHLLGYTDKTKTHKTEMTKQENGCLKLLKTANL
jgi:probable rRNA maturation factor